MILPCHLSYPQYNEVPPGYQIILHFLHYLHQQKAELKFQQRIVEEHLKQIKELQKENEALRWNTFKKGSE